MPRPSRPRHPSDYIAYTDPQESTFDWTVAEQNTLGRVGYYQLYHDMVSLRQSLSFSAVLIILGIFCLLWWYANQ